MKQSENTFPLNVNHVRANGVSTGATVYDAGSLVAELEYVFSMLKPGESVTLDRDGFDAAGLEMDRDEDYEYDYDDSTDDGEALASAGFGTDEDYGYYGDE